MIKTVLITGATAGFGKACAELFGRNGFHLVLAARRTERLQELQKELGGEEKVHIVTLDVRDRDAVEKQLSNLPEPFSEIDILINNAGLAMGLEPAHKAQMDDWQTMVDTNINGLMYCTRAILPGMVERNRGHVINLGSIAGNWPYPGGNTYGATKAFVQQFSRNLRADLLGTRVRVTNIEPGMAESEFSIVRFGGDKEKADQVYKNTDPLTPEDIAEIIYWTATVPPHVNINAVEVMPVCQSWGALPVSRDMQD